MGLSIDFEEEFPETLMTTQEKKDLKMVQKNWRYLQDVELQTLAICMVAVKKNGLALGFVQKEFWTPEICMAAVRSNGEASGFMSEQTLELCMAAIHQNRNAIQYIINSGIRKQVEEILQQEAKDLEKVTKSGLALEHIQRQNPEICMAAVQQDGRAIQWVKDQIPKISVAAVRQNGEALKWIREQAFEICTAAVQQNADAIQYIREPGMRKRVKEALKL